MVDSLSDNSKRLTKEVSVSIRMYGHDAETIDSVADRVKINRSELIRRAASNFIKLNAVDNPEFPNPKLILSHNLLKILCDAVDENTIKKLAKLSFENGKHDYDYIKKITQKQSPEEIRAMFPEDPIKSVIRDVFSPDGLNWFEKIQYTHRGNRIIISGSHDMGKNFSIFIKYLLDFQLAEIDYHLIKSDMGETELMENRNNKIVSYLRFEYGLKEKINNRHQ